MQFQEAVKLRGDYLPPKLALARLDLARGEYAKAMQGSAEILSVDPNHLGAKLIHSSALLGSGELRQARDELEALVKARPDSSDAQFQLAMLNFSERKFKEAENIFRKLHDDNPNDPRGFMGMIESHMVQGRQAQAFEMLQNVIQKTPDRPDYRLALANVAVRANKFDLAISEYQSLLAKNPKSADVHLRLGETFRRMGDAQNAIKHFGQARELAPNDPAANVQLALMLEGTGKREDAKPLYEHVLKIDPDNAIVLNNLAYMLADQGSELDHALTLAQRAKQKFPTNPDIADTLGWIYIKKNLSDNAISIFRDLTSKHGHVSTYHYRLAMALFQKGDKPQAKKALETALKNNPTKEEEGKIKELLNRIG
jgi:tetratricopeptide (TPR) repeat protein